MGETQYAAVTGDLVASRKVPSPLRVKIQKGILRALDKLNQDFGQDLARPAALTAGDEIQALFRVPSRIVEFVQVIKDGLFDAVAQDQEIVFGVGWGVLSTGLFSEAASVEQLDGTCFHLARENLTRAKKRKEWVVFRGFGEINDRALTSLFELMGAIRAGWTATQAMYAADLREFEKRIEVAKKRGVSPSVITESLQLSCFEAIRNGEESARLILRQFDPTDA